MNIIAIDDENAALRQLERAIYKTMPSANVKCFLLVREALAYAESNAVDVAFLDIEMSEMNGLLLARRLKEINKNINIIFVTGYSEYALEAFDLLASGYVLKPINPERVAFELENLRHAVQKPGQEVRVQCFGNFGVFVEGQPLMFTRTKAKELLAYLVHRQGATISSAEIAAVLWEDKEYNHSLRTQTQKAISHLIKMLEGAGIGDIIIRNWNSMAVDAKKFNCDYYDYLQDKEGCMGAFTGEYMSEYSWAESTVAFLNGQLE